MEDIKKTEKSHDISDIQESSLNENRIIKTKWFKWFLAAITFVVVSIVVFLFVMKGLPWGMEKRGQLGDMFGIVGALFSGLAFAGVIVTMLQQNEDLNLQRKDLALQRQEIAQTNKELELQRAEMQEQNKTIMLQRFENTFFSMLETQQLILRDLVIVQEDEIKKKMQMTDSIKSAKAAIMGRNMSHNLGSNLLVYDKQKTKEEFNDREPATQTPRIEKDEESLSQKSKSQDPPIIKVEEFRGRDAIFRIRFIVEYFIFKSTPTEKTSIANVLYYFDNLAFNGGRLEPYFQQINFMMDYIDRSQFLTIEEQYNYVCMLRTTFSSDELTLIFYYGLSKHSDARYKQLIEKYALFKNLRKESLFSENHYNLYCRGAYEFLPSIS